MWLAAFVSSFVCVAQMAYVIATLARCQGQFVYSLDDPYIHLALARQISQGHYGLNPGEVSAPSSSFLWPFLLAPLARFSWFVNAPLFMNIVCGTLSAGLVALAFGEVFGERRGSDTKLVVFGLTALTVVASNGIVLALDGMEHTLQMLLTNAAALGLVYFVRNKSIPAYLSVALALAPLVRYENLALTGAACAWLFLAGYRRTAVVSFLVPVLILAAFSLLLHANGLGWLPTSVIAKTHGSPNNGPLFFFAAVLLIGALLCRSTCAWPILTVAAVATFFHAFFGRSGWGQRYEVYLYSFGLIAIAFGWVERNEGRIAVRIVALAMAGLSLLWTCRGSVTQLRMSTASSSCVFRQQLQTARFVRDFYRGPVACNDIGAVAFGSGQYVLDLWGLGSLEALKARLRGKHTDWAGPLVDRHHIGLVAIYDDWIPIRPSSWVRIGALTVEGTVFGIGVNKVSYYAATSADVPKLRSDFDRFVKTLPAGVSAKEG